MPERLSKWERWWLNAWPHRWHVRRFVPRFLKACPDPFRGEVLEVGAGGGWTSRQILETFPQVQLTASDIDDRAQKIFEKMRERYGKRLNFVVADLRQLPFDREAFDLVVAIQVLHYVDQVEESMRQLIRVTRAGGLIGVTGVDFSRGVRKLTSGWRQVNMLDLGRVEQILKQENCEIVVTEEGEYYYVWARKPYPISPAEKEVAKAIP